jgi:hypothetical protein
VHAIFPALRDFPERTGVHECPSTPSTTTSGDEGLRRLAAKIWIHGEGSGEVAVNLRTVLLQILAAE